MWWLVLLGVKLMWESSLLGLLLVFLDLMVNLMCLCLVSWLYIL